MPSAEANEPVAADILRIPDAPARWVVVKVRARCEKRVAHHCRERLIPVYMPLRTKTHHYGRRVRHFSSPLFPGYLFCVATSEQETKLLQTWHVVQTLEVLDQSGLLEQLKQIALALETNELLEVMPFLETGRTVVVRGGPLKGLEGVVQRLKGRTRVVVNVEMIQQSVAVEVDSADLGPG